MTHCTTPLHLVNPQMASVAVLTLLHCLAPGNGFYPHIAVLGGLESSPEMNPALNALYWQWKRPLRFWESHALHPTSLIVRVLEDVKLYCGILSTGSRSVN